mmetsp:Transcript_775/g.2400  ORF Transcript_775/g.2400 Transcript_775/m.2400 type:complete len:250 (-) Transcript_775:213-962(-)
MVSTSSYASASARSTSTETSSRTCSSMVLVMSNCSTTCDAKMCFTQDTVYSVSFSTSSTASQDLKSGPRSANSGICCRASSKSDLRLRSPERSPDPEAPGAPGLDASTGTSSFSGTPAMSKASVMGVSRYSLRQRSSPASDTFWPLSTFGLGVGSCCSPVASSPNSLRYIVARSLTSSSLSLRVLLSSTLTRGAREGTLMPKLASAATAAARTVAFSKMIRLYTYLMYFAGWEVLGPSSPSKCRIWVDR